jgi:transposase-like protein
VSEGEIITRRRKWSLAQKSALLDEVEAENGKVAVVARRHGISESLLYNWRSAWKSTACAVSGPEPVDFVPLGVLGEVNRQRRPLLAPPTPERAAATCEMRTVRAPLVVLRRAPGCPDAITA